MEKYQRDPAKFRDRLYMSLKWYKKAVFMWFMKFVGYRFKKKGKCVFCLGTSSFFEGDTISIGDYVFINKNAYLTGNIDIGHFVQIAANVAIVGGDHNFSVAGVPLEFAGLDGKGGHLKTVIGDDVWIGHGAIIRGGIEIGRGAIVGAGSVVVNNVEPYTVVAGNPARRIRDRFTRDESLEHDKSLDMLIKSSNAEYESYNIMKKMFQGNSRR